MYDYIIIGAGVIGSFIAQELSRYNVKTLVLEAENDIANQTSMANSAIVHSGYDPKPGSLKAKLNAKGNKMYTQLCEYYQIPISHVGSLTLAFNEEDVDTLKKLALQAIENDVEVEILDANQVKQKEPNVRDDVVQALYAPSAKVVYPWQISFALMDHAIENGVELKLNQKVKNIIKVKDYYQVATNNSEFVTKSVINCAGVYGVKIQEMLEEATIKIKARKGQYFVLSRGAHKYLNHVIFPLPSTLGKGVLATPISEREILIGPTSEFMDDFDDLSTTQEGLQYIKDEITHTMDNVPLDRIIRSFSGLRSTPDTHDFIIEESKQNNGFYNIIGIESPGFASAPAISKYFADEIADFKQHSLKNDFIEYKATTRIKQLSKEQRHDLIKENPNYGQIVCRCEEISLQEVLEALEGNVKANSVKGVKKRVRPGMGNCQGGFCEPDIVKIIASKNNITLKDVVYDDIDSQVVVAEGKEEFIRE